MTDDEQPTAPNMRTFSLKSDEAYKALCQRRDEPWIPNGALPREPRAWEREVIVGEGRCLPRAAQGGGGARCVAGFSSARCLTTAMPHDTACSTYGIAV